MTAAYGSDEWTEDVAGTVWRLIAARGDDAQRSNIMEDALTGFSPAEVGLFSGHVLGEILSTVDGLVVDHPQTEELMLVIESKAELATMFKGLGTL